jgi:hyperosmotically inducible protein
VSLPWKKVDLGRLVERLPGVESVTNNLKVLPTSSFDDELRIRIARAIFRDPVLSRYAMQVVPPIHIIVENGRVKLEGVVNSEMEKNVAGVRASTAGMSFGSVENNLRVENTSKKS